MRKPYHPDRHTYREGEGSPGGVIAGVISGSMELMVYTFMGALGGIIVVGRGERFAQFGQAAVAIAVVDSAVVVAFAGPPSARTSRASRSSSGRRSRPASPARWRRGDFAVSGTSSAPRPPSNCWSSPTRAPLLRRCCSRRRSVPPFADGRQPRRAGGGGGRGRPAGRRVAAYYHDVGKLPDPAAFIENLAGRTFTTRLTPEELLRPRRRARRSWHRPRLRVQAAEGAHRLRSAAPWHRAHGLLLREGASRRPRRSGRADEPRRRREAGDRVDQRRFRHAGPKPQTREAAILMLADSVEASVRSPRATTSLRSGRWSADHERAASTASSTSATSRCATSTASGSRSSVSCSRCTTGASPIRRTRSWSSNRDASAGRPSG